MPEQKVTPTSGSHHTLRVDWNKFTNLFGTPELVVRQISGRIFRPENVARNQIATTCRRNQKPLLMERRARGCPRDKHAAGYRRRPGRGVLIKSRFRAPAERRAAWRRPPRRLVRDELMTGKRVPRKKTCFVIGKAKRAHRFPPNTSRRH